MKSLFSQQLTYTTKLSVDEIIKRLDCVIGPRQKIGFGNHGKPYQGELNTKEKTFAMSQVDRKNSFLPQITGIISGDVYEAEVKIKMKAHPFVIMFMAIFLGFPVGGWIFGMIMLVIFSRSLLSILIFLIGTFLLVGLLFIISMIFMTIIKYKNRESKKFIENLLSVQNSL